MRDLRICVLCEAFCSSKDNNMMTIDKKRTFLGNPAGQKVIIFFFVTF
jgi:hypothetical protein